MSALQPSPSVFWFPPSCWACLRAWGFQSPHSPFEWLLQAYSSFKDQSTLQANILPSGIFSNSSSNLSLISYMLPVLILCIIQHHRWTYERINSSKIKMRLSHPLLQVQLWVCELRKSHAEVEKAIRCFVWVFFLSSIQFSRSVMSDSLRPHGLQHTRLPCPSPTPGACSNSHPSSWWCHPTISSSVVPFSSCLQSFPASGSFPMS